MMENNAENKAKYLSDISIYGWRYKFVAMMFYLSCLIALVAIVTGYNQYIMLADMQYGISISEATIDSNDTVIYIVGIIQTTIALLTVIAFLLWFYKSFKNVMSLSNQSLRFSAIWSVGGFFVPLLNLVIPYKVAKEIWYASNDVAYDPNLLNKRPMVVFIMLWWLLFIISSGASRISSHLLLIAEDVQGYIDATVSYMISDALITLGAIAAIYMVKSISKTQAFMLSKINNLNIGQP